MKEDIKALEKVNVKTESELRKALQPFLTDTTIRKLLLEGMEIAKRQAEFVATNVDDEAYGGFKPAVPATGKHYIWVDTLIERRLDAKRDGLKIIWNLSEGRFEFDPWTKQLEQTSGPNS